MRRIRGSWGISDEERTFSPRIIPGWFASTRPQVRNCAPGNLEVLRCASAHLSSLRAPNGRKSLLHLARIHLDRWVEQLGRKRRSDVKRLLHAEIGLDQLIILL